MNQILFHICCAPCANACVDQLRAEGIEPVGFWYNINIHPYTEYRSRRDTLIEYAKNAGMDLRMEHNYGLREFTKAVAQEPGNRCGYCYINRMERAAEYASEHGFAYFSSSLLISPYQNHELVRQTGEEYAAKYDVKFLYRDFRPLFQQGQARAREMGMYMQKYCGCIYSEEERYQSKKFKKRANPAETE